MATISANTSNGKFQISLTVTESSYSTAENTSLVSWSFQIKSLGLGGFGDYGIPRTATINGTNVVNSSAYTSCYNNQTTSWGSGSLTIPHNDDGSKTISISFSATGLGDYSWNGTVTQSGSLTLTTIPRASTLTLTASSLTITNATATLGFTATSKGNFYHKLSWKVGSSSSSVVSGWNPKQINTTSASGTINTGAILDKMPTSTSGTLTFTLETFTDSAMTNKTGTSTATCSISINTSNIKPSVSLGTIGVNTPSSFTNLVAGYSTAKVTVTSTNSRGASSFSTSFTISKGSLSANSTSSTSYTLTTNTLPSGTSNYTFTITATITDSRGVSATASKTSGTVYGYATPVISAQFYRVASSGSSTADPIGGYVYRSFSATQSYKVNNWNTTLTVTAKQDGTTVTSGTTSALADTSSATLVVTATDKVTTVTKTLTVGTATFPLDLYDDAEGTVGVGMGTTAVGNKVKSNMEFDIVDGSDVVQSAMDPSGNIYSRKNVISGATTDTAEVNHTVQSSGGKLQMFINDSVKGLYGVNKSSKGQNILRVMEDGRVLIYGADASGVAKQMIGHNGSNLWIGCAQTGTTHHIGNTYIDAGYDSANSKGFDSIRISVPNTANNGATNHLAYHEGYFPPLDFTLITTGVSAYSSRATITSGGYYKTHKMCYVNLYITINTSLGTNSNWTLFTGFPAPLYETALACAPGPSNTGNYNARIESSSVNGAITVCTGSTALSSGKIVCISGWYQTAS